MNSKMTEMKNTPEGINSRKNETEEQVSDLEDRSLEITATEQNKEKRIRDFCGGAVVKNPPANAGDRDSSPVPGRFHMPQGS